MTTKMKEAIEVLRNLPEDEQERVVDALLAFVRERADYDLIERTK